MAKLICFDLWETLVTESSTTEGIWEPLIKAFPAQAPWPKVHAFIKQILHKKDQATLASVREIFEELGVGDDGLAVEVSTRWDVSCAGTAIFPDTIEALEQVRKKGFQMGLITNTSRYGWDVVEKKFQLGHFFDYRAVSFECKAVKPEPAIFEYIEHVSGLKGADVMMIGDSYKSDFVSPRERGWGSIFLDRVRTNEHPEAKPRIQNLLEIKSLLL